MMIYYLITSVTLVSIVLGQQYVENLGDNDMDFEIPAQYESQDFYEDPKESFFRSMRSFDNNNFETVNNKPQEGLQNFPKPGGFRNQYFESHNENDNLRRKRETEPDKEGEEPVVNVTESNRGPEIEKQLGKPLELAVLEGEKFVEKKATTTLIPVAENEESPKNNFLINDFIRFRRNTGDKKNLTELEDLDTSPNDSIRPKRNHQADEQTSSKMRQTPSNLDQQSNRGTTKEQWIKQPYPVQRNDDSSSSYQDNYSSSSESARAPRVHFVTQRRSSEAAPAPPYMSYEREARSRNLNRDLSRDFLPDVSREVDNYYYQPRFTRHYEPPPPPRYRYDPVYRYDDSRDRYNPRYDNYYPEYAPSPNSYSGSSTKQKRVIYYATLPEVVRTPPNVDLRYRYSGRDRYDDRYQNSNSPAGDPYLYRKAYPKSRYEDTERNKAPYPLKVSTDVNVREIKKNPERRIYSEVDRSRYAFKAPPYRSETSPYGGRQ